VALIENFPYLIHFNSYENTIVIKAIFHTSRNTEYGLKGIKFQKYNLCTKQMKRKDLQHIIKSTLLKVEHEHAPADAFLTAEGIELKQTYSEQDIENIKHLDFGAGFAPNLRGPYATMYVADLGLCANMQDLLPKKAMLLQTKLGCWSKGLSIAFDLPTHRGYDSDHERVVGDVGKAGVATLWKT
jgi:methylmalonyl-CoA mutase